MASSGMLHAGETDIRAIDPNAASGLIADAYRDARDIGLDYERLGKLVRETSATPKREKALEPVAELMRAVPIGDR